MESADKNWAKEYLLDPLNAPDPAEETGPGSHFVPPPSSASNRTETPTRSQSAKLSKNPYRRLSKASKNPFIDSKEASPTSTVRGAESYPTPPHSASPQRSRFFANNGSDVIDHGAPSKTGNASVSASEVPQHSRSRRSASLRDHFPNDPSVQPLKQIKQSHRKANHAPHLKKHHQIKPDTIDQLDNIADSYHHEGPFDATYLARNTSYINSPVEALASSNEEALRATPRAHVLDSIRSHRPLDGVASVPSGLPDRDGRVYRYEEGENMMIEANPPGGAYKRWNGVQYHPDDIKGKGEPSYSIEKALKDHKRHEKERYQTGGDFELASRPRSAGSERFGGNESAGFGTWAGGNSPSQGLGRSNTTSDKRRSGSGNLKKRFGSMRRKAAGPEDEAQ